MFINLFAAIAIVFTLILVFSAMVSLLFRVPYVPTKKRLIPTLLKLAGLKKGMTIYDLGCGDGRLLFTAEKKYGTAGIGYELSPIPYFFALAHKLINGSAVKIYFKNFFGTNLKDAKTVFLYLTPSMLKKIAQKLKKECHKGTLIITHTFHMEGLKPLKVIAANPRKKQPIIYIYKL